MSLGLVGTLEMSKRALDTNRQGIELTGHNLSNVSNPAYSRQRLKIQTSDTLPGPSGPIGTGSQVAQIEQLRSSLLDAQISNESSVSGFLEAKQKALQFGEVNLGQQIDRQANTPEETAAAIGIGGQFGLVEGFAEFFNSLQALTTNPSSTADRQVVLLKSQNLTDKFNSVDSRLVALTTDLNSTVTSEIANANQFLTEISDLSKSITASELGSAGSANDLKDRRQEKIEALAKLVNIQYSTNATDNSFNLSVSGTALITSNNIVERLQAYTPAGGNTQVATVGAPSTALTLTGGSLLGTMDARDGAIATLKSDINNLASLIITKVNTIHSPGFALDSSTGRNFFSGTDAATIQVNSALVANPSFIQASAVANEPGNNQIALQLARLSTQSQPALSNLTFIESYNQTVANFGQALSNVNTQTIDQDAVNLMLMRQRDSLGGVSVDEEMTNLVIFQRAFQASAKMINVIDELLQGVIALGS